MAAQDRDERAQRIWAVMSKASGIAGAVLTRKLLEKIWASASDSTPQPPSNPADRRIEWRSALQWGVAAGVGAGIARVVGQRAAAAGWEAATGTSPPGVRTH